MKNVITFLKRDMTQTEKEAFRWVCLGLVVAGFATVTAGLWVSLEMVVMGGVVMVVGIVGMYSTPNL